MPGTIQVSVLGLTDVQSSSSASSNTSIKVAMGKLEHQTSDSGDYTFPVTRLRENLIVTLLNVNGDGLLRREIETRMIIENGFLEEKLSLEGYGNIHLKMQFVLSEEDRNRIRFLRQSALRKKHEELVNGNFAKSKSIASDLPSLRSIKAANENAVIPVTNLGQSDELKTNADRELVMSSLVTWKPKVTSQRNTLEKTKTQPSSLDVSASNKLLEVKKTEDKALSEPERNTKRKYLRRSMSETNLSNVRKMISTFEVRVTQDSKIRPLKIQPSPGDKTKVESEVQSFVNVKKPKERKRSFEDNNVERREDLGIVLRDEKGLVAEEKSVEESTRGSNLVTKERRKQSLVDEGRDEKKLNKSLCWKESQLQNLQGSRLWIFPDESKDLGTRLEAIVLKKKIEEENISERGIRSRNVAKMCSKGSENHKWKNIERSKKQKSESCGDSDRSRGPVGQVMRALIVVGFAGLVFLTRQRT